MFEKIKEKIRKKNSQPKQMLFKLIGELNEETGNYICKLPHFNAVFTEDGECTGVYNPEWPETLDEALETYGYSIVEVYGDEENKSLLIKKEVSGR